MSKRRTIASIEKEIAATRQKLKTTQARYDRLAKQLQLLDKELMTRQAEVLLEALAKSGKSTDDVLTFLRR